MVDTKRSDSAELENEVGGISGVVAILIAKGLVADEGFDLNLYRPESILENNDLWKVDFKLKERYRRFNIRCPVVLINKRSGEIGKVSFQECNSKMPLEYATQATPSSLPHGSIGIYVGDEKQFLFEIFPWEWEALFWDELRAMDPHFSPDWQKRFADSIAGFPMLSRIQGELGTTVTFHPTDIEVLIAEAARVSGSAKNPVALGVVRKILTACELARERHSSLRFMGD